MGPVEIKWSIILFLLPILFVTGLRPLVGGQRDLNSLHSHLAQEVRHVLALLPNYTLFDFLEFEISGIDTVTLLGQVTRPTLKSDAESAVRGLEGVARLVNKIEVLPVSPRDEQIRAIAYQAIYYRPGLDRYAFRSIQPIHIIVNKGSITLAGVVATQTDKDLAETAAREVPGTLGVTNNLSVKEK